MADLAVIILTFNEQIHLARAIEHAIPIAKEIFIIDSYSTDSTIMIAKRYGVCVLQNPFINQAKQFQWALDNAPITAGWVMKLDADEVIKNDLAREISEKLPKLKANVVGVNLRRKTIFLNRWIRFGGRTLTLLRIWRRGMARVEDRWMDEHIVISDGDLVTFSGGFADHNLNDLTCFTDKHNKYATREAVDVISKRYKLFEYSSAFGPHITSKQATLKRVLKERVYNYIPFELAAFGYFVTRYVLLLGMLDGRTGLSYHFLQAYWYRFLVGAKIREYDRALKGLNSAEDQCEELARLTGLKIESPGPRLQHTSEIIAAR